jgi:hypothetical protein
MGNNTGTSMLEDIETHRALFFGTHRCPLSCLRAFLSGFEFGRTTPLDQQGPVVPPGFRTLVARRFGIDPQLNTGSWYEWIIDKSASEEEAFAKFFELYKESKLPQ